MKHYLVLFVPVDKFDRNNAVAIKDMKIIDAFSCTNSEGAKHFVKSDLGSYVKQHGEGRIELVEQVFDYIWTSERLT
jgi:hypothetical protein